MVPNPGNRVVPNSGNQLVPNPGNRLVLKRGNSALEDPATQDLVFKNLERAVAELIEHKKRVALVLSSPRGKEFDPRTMAQRVGLGFEIRRSAPTPRTTVAAGSAVIDDRLRSVAERLGAEIVDPLDYICSSTDCPATDSAGNPLYMDVSHIRESVVLKQVSAFDAYVYVGTPQLPASGSR